MATNKRKEEGHGDVPKKRTKTDEESENGDRSGDVVSHFAPRFFVFVCDYLENNC